MKIPALKTTHLLNDTDLNRQEILSLFKLAARLKAERLQGKHHRLLEGKTLGMIFEKSSTRTRVSFEAGMYQLGGHALFLNRDDIQMGRGETVSDTARVLSRYLDGVMIRTHSHGRIVDFAKHSDIPVINGLTDTYHPCQALADLFTIYEREQDFRNVRIAYVGDGNNISHSLLLCSAILGADITVASPRDYTPEKAIVELAFSLSSASGSRVSITSDINLAAEGANYLYTDVWISMGQEKQAGKRKKALSRYRITGTLLKRCAENCRVMHCLPAHRGEEIDADVMESDRSIIFDQAENRLHIQKSILCSLLR